MTGDERSARAADFVARYDEAIFDPRARAIYDGSDFYNVGDWSDGPSGPPSGLGEAAGRLVARHLDSVAAPKAVRAVVLDIGCGLGAGAAMMAERYRQAMVVGLNFSLAQARYAARRTPQARFAVMNAVSLAVAADSVDLIHCIEAAFHFDARDDFLGEIRRVLRPGGVAVLTDITFRRDYARSVPTRNVWAGEAEYRARCERAGLLVDSLVDITNCTLAPFYTYLKAHGRGAEAALHRRAQDAYYLVILRKPLS